MSFTLQPGGFWVGTPRGAGSNPAVGTALLMSAAAHFTAFYFIAPKTGTLHSFEIRLGTVTVAPANGLTFSFQNGDTNGNPDNTDDQTRVVTAIGASNTWLAPPGPITSDGTDTGTKRSVTAGDKIAAHVKFTSFTAGDSLNWATMNNSGIPAVNFAGRRSTNSGTSWTKSIDTPIIVIRYTDGYEFTLSSAVPVVTFNSGSAYNNASTPDERGLRFKIPFDFELTGVEVIGSIASVTAAYVLKVYSATDSLLDSCTIVGGDLGPINTLMNMYFPLTRFSPYSANAVHRATIVPAASNVTIHDFDVNANGVLDAVGGGAEWYYTQRTDAGAWTDTTTKRPWMRLHLSRIDAVVGQERGSSFAFIG